LKYVPLSDLQSQGWIGNPKLHDEDAIIRSISRHGFKDPIKWEGALNGGEGGIVEGNGRLVCLLKMHGRGDAAPRGIIVRDGDWLVPVLFGVDAPSELLAVAYGVDHNVATIVGGGLDEWDALSAFDYEQLAGIDSDVYDKLAVINLGDLLGDRHKDNGGIIDIEHNEYNGENGEYSPSYFNGDAAEGIVTIELSIGTVDKLNEIMGEMGIAEYDNAINYLIELYAANNEQ